MAYNLGDIFIGNFPVSQEFGARPDIYQARYGIKSHNGRDWAVPSLTLILSAADGYISEIGSKELGTYDTAGYGNYIKIVHDGYLTLYGHLNDISVKKGDHVVAGQLIGHSNNTGFSDGPHLHFGVAPCDAAGNKTEKDNGWSGYIDPIGNRCSWDVKNLTKPVDPHATTEDTKIPVPSSDFTRMVSEGSNYRVIASDLIQHGLNQFLSENGLSQIDLENKNADPMAGENIAKFLRYQREELDQLKTKSEQLQAVPIQDQVSVGTPTTTILPEQTTQAQAEQIVSTATPLTDLIKKLYSGIKAFIFVT